MKTAVLKVVVAASDRKVVAHSPKRQTAHTKTVVPVTDSSVRVGTQAARVPKKKAGAVKPERRKNVKAVVKKADEVAAKPAKRQLHPARMDKKMDKLSTARKKGAKAPCFVGSS